jgi:hypothetical protein
MLLSVSLKLDSEWDAQNSDRQAYSENILTNIDALWFEASMANELNKILSGPQPRHISGTMSVPIIRDMI